MAQTRSKQLKIDKPVKEQAQAASKGKEEKKRRDRNEAPPQTSETKKAKKERTENKTEAKVKDTKGEKLSLQKQEEVLEYGRIYFFYKPKVNDTDPKNIDDVAKLHIVLTPQKDTDGKPKHSRLIIMGRKILPESHQQPLWGFVKTVSKDGASLRPHLLETEYETKTQGTRQVAEDRLFGEVLCDSLCHFSVCLQ